MAGPLRNVRHERFVQALFEGQNATEAYATAGFVKPIFNSANY
jgi:phage terminase small subunit